MDYAFWNAVDNDDVDRVAELLEQSSSWVKKRFSGEAWKPCHIWSYEARTQVPTPAEFRFTNMAIHTAAVNSRTEMVQLLLRHGADANAIGYEPNKGLTPPVVLATWEGSFETVQALLENGADPNIAASAETALYTAAEHGLSDKVKLLLAHGARHDIFSAAIAGDVEFVERALAACPALKNARSMKRGRTPMEEAEHHEQSEVLKLFQLWK